MGFILLSTTLMGSSTKKLRRMLSEEYHDVIVVTIAQNRGYDSAFSHDTNMKECIVVATKGVGANTGRAKFVCLTERPDSLLTAQTLANLIRRQRVHRRLEDLPNGGDELRIGEHVAGYLLDAPIDETEWTASNIRAFSLIQMGYRLREGILHLPRMSESHTIPMCTIGDIAVVGINDACIKDETLGRGAFHVREGAPTSAETYPMLWKADAKRQRAMHTSVNANGRIQQGKDQKAHDILARKSQTHYHLRLVFNANSVIASWTSEPTVGVCSLTNVVLDNFRYEAAWTLWANSTLGLLCHWMSTSKQQAGRGRSSLGQLPSIATLDVRRLSTEQLAKADTIFAELKDARMLPYNECKSDPWRHVLDARLLAEVLGITDKATHKAMQNLREMLCAEPTIAGTKLEKNFCDLEEEREKFALGGCAAVDAKTLAAQQRALEAAGISLPAV